MVRETAAAAFRHVSVLAGHIPSLDEAKARLDHLAAHGDSDFAFGWLISRTSALDDAKMRMTQLLRTGGHSHEDRIRQTSAEVHRADLSGSTFETSIFRR